jgi:hypothetical protein
MDKPLRTEVEAEAGKSFTQWPVESSYLKFSCLEKCGICDMTTDS